MPLLLSVLLHAQPSKKYSDDFWILTNPEAPFVVVDDKRNMSGYLIDVVQGILNVAGIKQDILAAPWERVEREARTKSNVLIFALARTPDRENRYHWITPLTSNVYSVFSVKGEKDQFSEISELIALDSIAVLENDVRHKILIDANYPRIHVYPTWEKAIDAVISGRSEAIFFSEPGIRYMCWSKGNDCNVLKRVFMYWKISSYLTMSKVNSDPVLVECLIKAAIEFKQSKLFEDLVTDWLVKYKTQPIPMHLEQGVMNLWQQ